MTNLELQTIQRQIKFDAPSMAACLGISYDQYRRYYYGAVQIPESIERAVMELVAIEKEFDIQREKESLAFLEKHYPHGIPSEAIEVDL